MKKMGNELAIIFIPVLFAVWLLWQLIHFLLNINENISIYNQISAYFFPLYAIISYSICLLFFLFIFNNIIKKRVFLVIIHLFSINFLFFYLFFNQYIELKNSKSFYEIIIYENNIKISWFFSTNIIGFIYLYLRKDFDSVF